MRPEHLNDNITYLDNAIGFMESAQRRGEPLDDHLLTVRYAFDILCQPGHVIQRLQDEIEELKTTK